jgi:ESS family glutamate:Na+ symporter
MDVMTLLIDVSIIAVLLLVGSIIRAKVRLFQRFVIPAAVIGGIIGLVFGHNMLNWLPTSESYVKYASTMINVIFASLFIGRTIPHIKKLGETAGTQTLFAVFNNFGQIAIGMIVVILFTFFGSSLHPTFGMQLILGYQGGVGVPTAFAKVYEQLGWSADAAAAVGEACALTGLILSILVGLVLVNIGIARGYTKKTFPRKDKKVESATFLPEGDRKSVGKGVTNPDALSNLGYNFAFLAIAIIIGKVVQLGLVGQFRQLRFIPLFPFVLVGGILVQIFLQLTKLDRYVDRGTVSSISSVTLDILIIAALIGLKPQLVVMYAAPLAVMIILGLVFNLWQTVWLAPRVLPGAWFEKSLCEFGQGTGSTPSAMLLLRSVDPELRTDAAEAFALKMFFTSPTMVPMLMLISPLVATRGPLFTLAVYAAGMAVIFVLFRLLMWRKKGAAAQDS